MFSLRAEAPRSPGPARTRSTSAGGPTSAASRARRGSAWRSRAARPVPHTIAGEADSGGRSHILNLSHGLLADTPFTKVQHFVDIAHALQS